MSLLSSLRLPPGDRKINKVALTVFCLGNFTATPSSGIIITHISQVFARKRGEDDTTAHVGFFNGIFSMFMVMTGVVGNLVSSLVFDSYNGACSGGSSSAGSDSELLGEGEAAIPVPQSAVDW